MTNTLKTLTGALAIAAALGVSAAPAQAQSFGFGFGFGNGGSGFSFGIGDDDDDFPRLCLSERQLRNVIRDRGYSNIGVNVPNDNRVQIRATRGGWVYLLEVNSCSGRILDRRRLRPA